MNTESIVGIGKKSIAVISPGLLPIPPILGGSVETVIQEMANETKKKFKIDIYGPVHSSQPQYDNRNGISYYRLSSKPYTDYFKRVREEIGSKNYSIIQVENRPLFVSRTKENHPNSKFILSLHSLDHINAKLISPTRVESVFSQCSKILVYSKFMADTLSAKFPIYADKFTFIHLGVKADLFRPRWEPEVKHKSLQLKKQLGIPADDKVLLFAGRLIPKKGAHQIIAAMKQILAQYPQTTLVIVGGSWYNNHQPTEYVTKLKQQALKYGSKVRFTNYVSSNEMPLLFAMSDIFLCPSLWDEPFGLVNVEAMASGLPVVASARGGIPEIVMDGMTGYLVKKETDPRSFLIPILSLLHNPCTAGAFGRNGRKLAEEYFNWPRAGEELIKLYEGLIR